MDQEGLADEEVSHLETKPSSVFIGTNNVTFTC